MLPLSKMSSVQRQRASSSTPRLRIYIDNHVVLILSMIILVCKVVLVVGILIAVFSNHWARSPNDAGRYAGYRARCDVHLCLSKDPDPTWLVDLICALSVINLLMELINITIVGCCSQGSRKNDVLLGKTSFENKN